MSGLKDKIAAMQDPAQMPQVQAAAQAITEVERDLHEAIQAHYEALGIEPPEDLPPAEERVDQFKSLVRHQHNGDLWGYFCQNQAPEDLVNTDAAREHAGKSGDEWNDTIQGWAGALREQLEDAEDVPARDLADRFTQRRYGVDLETFEAAVVRWSPSRTLRIATRGRMDADIRRLEQATAALEDADPDVDQEDVDGETDPETGQEDD